MRHGSWPSPGSSPHTRGAPRTVRGHADPPGIIPAYAGSTEGPVPCRARPEGSSPHTRGALLFTFHVEGFGGIIPAYAGSTSTRRHGPAGRWDHPRIRGEHEALYGARPGFVGSSPHTRGALDGLGDVREVFGIIPAYAGSTSKDDQWRSPSIGSSPHTRGAPRRRRQSRRGRRIIPAYAGSTCRWASGTKTRTDHPRIRGEHIIGSIKMVIGWGSSPHTRGARHADRRSPYRWRIIPAYAGSTNVLYVPR